MINSTLRKTNCINLIFVHVQYAHRRCNQCKRKQNGSEKKNNKNLSYEQQMLKSVSIRMCVIVTAYLSLRDLYLAHSFMEYTIKFYFFARF